MTIIIDKKMDFTLTMTSRSLAKNSPLLNGFVCFLCVHECIGSPHSMVLTLVSKTK